MVGLFGASTVDAVGSMMQTTRSEKWYETTRFPEGEADVALVHHGAKDPEGHTVYRSDDGEVAVHGVVSRAEGIDAPADELFERLLSQPGKSCRDSRDRFCWRGVRRMDRCSRRPTNWRRDRVTTPGPTVA